MKTHAQIAGEQWAVTSREVEDGHANFALAQHICWMLGNNDWEKPIWRTREAPPDGRTFDTKSFDLYLTRQAREGLGMPSMLAVHYACMADPKRGEEAIKRMKEEMPDYDRLVGTVAMVRGEAKGAVQGIGKKGDNVTLSERGNSSEYTIRRLMKEKRQDLVDQIKAGDISANAAAIEAGFRKKYYQIEATADAVKAFCKKHGINL